MTKVDLQKFDRNEYRDASTYTGDLRKRIVDLTMQMKAVTLYIHTFSDEEDAA
jgi:hypothetical protein